MGDRRLSSPLVNVIRDGHEDLTLQTTNADMIAWDLTRPKQRPPWPKFDEAPILWMTFLAFCAARRTGAIDAGYKWDTWRAEVLEVAPVQDDDAEEAGTGEPFPEGVEGPPDL
jgi:hypothetical protein